jgi:hypothetical protein
VEDWLERGNQPLLRVIGQELTESGGVFENATGPAIVASVSGAVIDDHSTDAGPTTASYCVKAWFLSETKFPPVPGAVDFALTTSQDCIAPGCTLTVPDLGNCLDFPICGDGVIDPNEQCDGVSTGGCSLGCLSDCTCSTTLQCPAAPSPSCITGASSSLKIRRGTDPTKDQLKWKVQKAGAVMQSDLGTPTSSTSYALCIYDETGGTPALAGSLALAPGNLWEDKAPKGLRYKDKAATQSGVRNVQLKTGEATKSKAQLGAKGSTVTWPSPIDGTTFFTQDSTVHAQLFNSSTSTCWSASFTASKKNDGERYDARSP